jgi:hypothetical protein
MNVFTIRLHSVDDSPIFGISLEIQRFAAAATSCAAVGITRFLCYVAFTNTHERLIPASAPLA